MLTLEGLKRKIILPLLDSALDIRNLPLKERVIVRYSQRVLDELNDLCHDRRLSENERIKKLQAMLENNWACINGTCLAYTALPEHPITELLCDVAEFVAQATEKSAIALLMPTVYLYHLISLKKNLDKLDLKQVLKTHILGREGKYLVPVELLVTLSYDDDFTKIINPYFDYETMEVDWQYLSQDELARLKTHHAITQAWFDTEREYEQLIRKDTSLLGQLSELTRLMLFNSVKGVGTEDVAARGGMIAVSSFFEFYNQLPEDQLSKVPETLKEELSILKDYGLPEKDRTHKNLPIIGSCLSTRHDALKQAMQGQETRLSDITISAESKKDVN